VVFLLDVVYLETGFAKGVETGTYLGVCFATAFPLSFAARGAREGIVSLTCSEGPVGFGVSGDFREALWADFVEDFCGGFGRGFCGGR